MGNILCLKIDLQKAFDSINRDCPLHYAMHELSSNLAQLDQRVYSVPLFIRYAKRLTYWIPQEQQGYKARRSTLPFIFVLVMEFLSIHMQLAMESGRIQPSKRNEQLHTSHLLFAAEMTC